MYGMVITNDGLSLLASLGTGATLAITRVMVGTGSVGSASAARQRADLVQPVALASSTKPIQQGNECSLVVEYRNDMNGGLDRDIEITEFGIWAQTGVAAEVLLIYACLDDRPKAISAYTSGSAIEVQRFPLSFSISNDCPVVLGYSALAFMTAEDVEDYCTVVVLPMFLEQAQALVDDHNISPLAHPGIRALIAALERRQTLLELQVATDVSSNSWVVTFESLDGLVVEGCWNVAMARMEF